MRIHLTVPEEKFLRAIQKKVQPDTLHSRLNVAPTRRLLGKAKPERFSLCFQKKGFFCLFPCTAVGKREKEGVWRVTFRRPLLFSLFLLLAVFLALTAGFSLLFSEPWFSLVFLIPAFLALLPLFRFSKRDKEELKQAILSFGATLSPEAAKK